MCLFSQQSDTFFKELVGGVQMSESFGVANTVTELFPRIAPHRDRVIVDLLNYWEHLRAGRVAPLRSEIDPRQINTALGHTFILETDRVGGIRFRLAGLKVCDLLGMELRGMPSHALIDPAYRDGFDDALATMEENPRKIEFRLSGHGQGSAQVPARMVLLPMQGPDGRITRILGGLSVRTPLFDPPLRFEIVEKICTRIVTGGEYDTAAVQSGFAENAAGFIHHAPAGPNRGVQVPRRQPQRPPRAKDGRAHLRLVK